MLRINDLGKIFNEWIASHKLTVALRTINVRKYSMHLRQWVREREKESCTCRWQEPITDFASRSIKSWIIIGLWTLVLWPCRVQILFGGRMTNEICLLVFLEKQCHWHTYTYIFLVRCANGLESWIVRYIIHMTRSMGENIIRRMLKWLLLLLLQRRHIDFSQPLQRWGREMLCSETMFTFEKISIGNRRYIWLVSNGRLLSTLE